LYNLEFEETKEKIDKLSILLPNHPSIDFLHALNLVWKTIPDINPDEFSKIESYLNSSIEKSMVLVEMEESENEAVFFLLMAHGLLAQYYGEQGSLFKALSESKKSYNFVIRGLSLTEQYTEYYFSSGLYNYYREKYPELHPIYKSFVWVFKSGDKEEGIRQIEYARTHALLSKVEAAHYLAYIFIRVENKPAEAETILDELIVEYPNNAYFKMLKIESLDMMEKLGDASDYIQDLLDNETKYARMFGNAYYGVQAEKIEKNPGKAMFHYKNALEIGSSFEDSGFHPKSVAYAGLGRISNANDDIKEAISYYKMARKIAAATQIKEEADEYIKNH